MKMAPTPIGPKWPANNASLLVLISGIHHCKAYIPGNLLKVKIPKHKRTILQGTRVVYVSFQALKGIVAPM